MTEELKKWDYRVQTCGSTWSSAKLENLEAALIKWGIEGWEVVNAFNVESSHKVTIVAKRPLAREVISARSMPSN
jgi:hypothetical protein